MEILGYDYEEMVSLFRERYGKGRFHAGTLFKRLWTSATADVREDPAYAANPALAERVSEEWKISLPAVDRIIRDHVTIKFRLRFRDGYGIESVIVPMQAHATLCVSSQVGCAMGCAMCETGRMGLLRQMLVPASCRRPI